MTTTTSSPSPMASSSNPLDLEITIISAKHLKNVNWRNGDLKPYVVFYLDSDHRLATNSDDSGSTRPVWNERFTLPITRPVRDSVLTLEIFHSKVSDTPKPFVGSLKFPLAELVDSDVLTQSYRKLELLRPSGRPQGKIRFKLAVKERPLPPPAQDYRNTPEYNHYYYSAPPPPPVPSLPPREYGYYSSYYIPQPPLPPQPLFNRTSNHNLPSDGVPSAPADFSPPTLNDYKQPPLPPRPSNYAVSSGSGPSAPVDYSPSPYDHKLQKQMGGLNLEEEVNSYRKEKRTENEFVARESYTYPDYRREC